MAAAKSKTKAKTTAASSEPTVTPEASETPQITLVDLQNALRIIDVASERGAFRGNELTSVGSVRDKLSAFLEASLPKESTPDGEKTDQEAVAA